MKQINVKLKIKFDKKTNGTPRKKLNSLAKKYGWKSTFSLKMDFI